MNSPVLLILFNRPDLTAELLQIVRLQKGRRIYIAADGPRAANSGDDSLCKQVHQLALDFASDYEGECHLQLQEENLGCGLGVKTALDWFFSHEEMGIVLEDDCHPSADFFSFQDFMLQRYRENKDIFSVGGSSLLPAGLITQNPIYLTKFFNMWGWGTWRRSWEKYQFQISNEELPDLENLVRMHFCSDAITFYWMQELRGLQSINIPHTWDFQLQFACWRSNALNIAPSINLVCNRGFRADATHTKEKQSRYVNKAGSWPYLSEEIQLPPYQPDLDILLFWTHFIGMDENRMKYLLLEADTDLTKHLQVISSLGDVYEIKRFLEWPNFNDVLKMVAQFLRKRALGFFKRWI